MDLAPALQFYPVKPSMKLLRVFEVMSMKRHKQVLLMGILALTLVGCGGNAYYEAANEPGPIVNIPIPIPTYPGVTGGTGVTSLLPPLAYSFSLTRDTAFTTVVNTDNQLKVRIRPDSAGKIGGNPGNFNGTYGCISYVVEVMGQAVRTAVLNVGGGANCVGAPTEQVIDFSSRLSPGHGPVTIKVSAAKYDFYLAGCLRSPYTYGVYYDPYYQWSLVQSSCYNLYYQHTIYDARPTVNAYHTVAGSIEVQVNGTSL